MARKTKEDAERTREMILDAAELAFREHGVSRTSLEQIARRAGCTRGAVYWHFRDKLDLFAALMARTQQPLFQRFERAVAPIQADPVEAMREATLQSIHDLATEPHARNMLEILFHRCEFVGELAPIVDQHGAKVRWVIAQSAAAFERAQAAGQIDPGLQPRLCAAMLHTLTTGILRDWLLAPDQECLQGLARAMLDHLLASFGHAPSRARCCATAA